jgi:hypothetical protein
MAGVAARLKLGHPAWSSTLPSPSIRVEAADYGFLELAEWHHLLFEGLGPVEGVVWTDIDEAANRVSVAARPGHEGRVEQAVRGRAQELGVPDAALNFLSRESPVLDVDVLALPTSTAAAPQALTIQEYQRPLRGGYKVTYTKADGTHWACTIGFVTMYNSQPAFVTASHCSRTFGGTDGAPYYQPGYDPTFNYGVGTEAYDPFWFQCNWVYQCRMTDSNIVSFSGTYGDIDHGRIARTMHSSGSKDVDPANPYFTIAGQMQQSIVGDTIHKIGQKTGWTKGVVNQTCLTIYFDSDKRVNCTDEATYHSNVGDSGAPVFLRWSDTHIYLYGIHHAGSPTYAYFSRMTRVQEDLGGVTVRPYSGGGGGTGCPDPTEPC